MQCIGTLNPSLSNCFQRSLSRLQHTLLKLEPHLGSNVTTITAYRSYVDSVVPSALLAYRHIHATDDPMITPQDLNTEEEAILTT